MALLCARKREFCLKLITFLERQNKLFTRNLAETEWHICYSATFTCKIMVKVFILEGMIKLGLQKLDCGQVIILKYPVDF
jgi:hypothetical protein